MQAVEGDGTWHLKRHEGVHWPQSLSHHQQQQRQQQIVDMDQMLWKGMGEGINQPRMHERKGRWQKREPTRGNSPRRLQPHTKQQRQQKHPIRQKATCTP